MKEAAGVPSQSDPDRLFASDPTDAAAAAVTNAPTQVHQPGIEELLRTIRQALRNERWKRAERFAGRALAEGLQLHRLRHAYAMAGRPELFVRAIWNHREVTLKDLHTIAWFARLAGETDAAEEYFAELKEWALQDVAREVGFGVNDYLQVYDGLDQRVIAALFCLKYGGGTLESAGDVFQKAADYADWFHLAPDTAGFFYRHRLNAKWEFSDWLRQVKTAQMLDHLICDAAVAVQLRTEDHPALRTMATNLVQITLLKDHTELGEAKRMFESLDRSRGLLVCTFHSGFLRVTSFFFVTAMPDPYWIARETRQAERPNIIIARDNERAAAFRTLKALSSGKAVFMAPDGPHHGEASCITVDILGMKTTISQGAAVLAYESNCDTAWLGTVRTEKGFAPQYIPGPRREAGESYKSFRDRWAMFYAQCVENVLSSEPKNVVFSSRWAWPNSKSWN